MLAARDFEPAAEIPLFRSWGFPESDNVIEAPCSSLERSWRDLTARGVFIKNPGATLLDIFTSIE
jgi:hypothetical protein